MFSASSDYSSWHALVGGSLIGLGSFIAAAASGKIPGISGMFSRLLRPRAGDTAWRVVFFVGLLAGAAFAFAFVDASTGYAARLPPLATILAGVLVGFGTRLGGGCTSGHGVCGVGLGSKSSIAATCLFMAAAMLAVILLAGTLFGAGLAISGMTNPARVLGFLDVIGAWDPSLVFVMAAAVLTFASSMFLLRSRRHGAGWFGSLLPTRDRDPIDRRLVFGALIFGAGWGLAGFCPGPALANLVAFRPDALLFVPAMAAGMLLARATFHVDR